MTMENDYILRKAAIEKIRYQGIYGSGYSNEERENDVVDMIESIPAADVRPVVRGHWIGTKEAEEMGDIMKEFTCSVCGCCEWDCTESESFNFCPNCGADMREES